MHDFGYGEGGGEDGGGVEAAVVVICSATACEVIDAPQLACSAFNMVSGQPYPVGGTGTTATCYDGY